MRGEDMTREEAIKEISEHKEHWERLKRENICTQEEGMLTIDAFDIAIKALEEQPKTGHWIKSISENGVTSAVRCSECGFEDNRYMLFRYCPNCGAKME